MNPISRLTLLGVVLWATGCSTVAYNAEAPDLGQCSASLDRMPTIPLRYPGPEEEIRATEFARLASCYHAPDETPVPAALYVLEGVSLPAQVDVSVPLSQGGTFAAAVDVLDAGMASLKRYAFSEFIRRGSEYSLSIFLNPSDAEARYLMLSPDPEHVGKSDVAVGSMNGPVVIPAGPVMFMYNHGTETNQARPFGTGGKVSVVVRPQQDSSLTTE